jgi:hypothetical protein
VEGSPNGSKHGKINSRASYRLHAAALALRERAKEAMVFPNLSRERTEKQLDRECRCLMLHAGPNIRNVQLYPRLIFSPNRDPLEHKLQPRIGFFLQCQQLLGY